MGAGGRPVRAARASGRAGPDPAAPDGRGDAVRRPDRLPVAATCPSATAPGPRSGPSGGAGARTACGPGRWRMAVVTRVLHDPEPLPSMVMVDAQTGEGRPLWAHVPRGRGPRRPDDRHQADAARPRSATSPGGGVPARGEDPARPPRRPPGPA